ncbi:FBP domain-containing protein [Galbitalea sp. SE-J8]|uniref:FBP domain-containing protein n=1 Tax=Galbitalea sp. SE-J8 TaxID=3054952 RepID=UPI00259CB816|nr:FBP domain-containing protein [Galbitalea sp. SE-J8]MDM4763841.1 FBP domain-containing protein [Galbitalea sp. SE-J8]
MLPLDDKTIRGAFINASRKELSDLSLPDLDAVDWDALDYLGWRDRRIARRAYVVIPTDDGPVGILLRQAEASYRTRAQCALCQDVTLPNEVVFYSAKRPGPAGRNGDTVGTLICADFQCSANVRKPPPPAYLGFDIEAARQERMASLRTRIANLARSLVEG